MKRLLFLTTMLLFSLLTFAQFSGTVVDSQGVRYSANYGNASTCYVSGHEDSYNSEIVIPEVYQGRTVTSIGRNAFSGCNGLASVEIPNSVTNIDEKAFRDCSGMTSVIIGNSVTSIGQYAFYKCSSLISVTIPNSVTSIGYEAFSCCSGLTVVTIPNSVTSIGTYAFDGCSGLTSLILEITSPFTISEYVFEKHSYIKTKLIIPDGTESLYKSTFPWNKFQCIVEKSKDESTQKARNITLTTAGTLSDFITEDEKYLIEELTLSGELNAKDFRLLREMAGNDNNGTETPGRLKYLDITNVNLTISEESILDGGVLVTWFDRTTHTHIPNYDCKISDNFQLPAYVFLGCTRLKTVLLPTIVR